TYRSRVRRCSISEDVARPACGVGHSAAFCLLTVVPTDPKSSRCFVMRTRVTQLVSVLVVCYFTVPATAENWSQFRGDNGSGMVGQNQLPDTWGPARQCLWKVSIPGVGWSQPVVWGDKIFVTTAECDKQSKPDPQN